MSGFRTLGVAVGYPGLPIADTLELAAAAEDAGFGIVSVGDGIGECATIMGALATRTRRAELLSAIMNWSRTPVTTALAATTLNELSDGRCALGLGTMPRQWSEDWHGVEQARPVARMRDYVGAIRAAWSSEPGRPVSYEGPYYRIEGYAQAVAPVHAAPPLYLAATLPNMTQAVGEIADGVVYNTITSAAWLRDVCEPRLEQGLAIAGRTRSSFDAGRLIYCAICDDPARARDLVRPALAFYCPVPYFAAICEHHGFGDEVARGREAMARGDVAGACAAIGDEMVATFALAGRAEEVREQLTAYEPLLDWAMLTVPIGNEPAVTRELAGAIVATFGR